MKPKKPLPPGVQSWRFGSPPPRPVADSDNPFLKREAAIEAIIAKNQAETDRYNAEVGRDPDAIARHWARSHPDIARDPDLLEDAIARVDALLEDGALNEYNTYDRVASEIRDDYDLQPKPAYQEKTDEERYAEGFQQIRDMRSGKLKVPPEWEIEEGEG